MIFFLYGPDDFRAKEKIREIKDKFLRELDQNQTSCAELSGEHLTLAKFHEAASINSLFARRRLIVVDNVLMNKDKEFLVTLLDYLKNKTVIQDNILVFYDPLVVLDKQLRPQILGTDKNKALNKAQQELFVFLQTGQHASYFKALDGVAAVAWVKSRISAAGLDWEHKALQALMGLTGNDLWLLRNEVDKLIHYQLAVFGDKSVITQQTVMTLVANQLEETIFSLTDALSNKNKSLAVRLLEEQFQQGVNEVYLSTMLLRQVKLLLLVRSALDSGLDIKKIGLLVKAHPYVLQKSLNQARNFNAASLRGLFNALIKLDYNYKSGKLPAPLMATLLLASI